MNGLNGKTTVAGQLVDKYAQANVPDNVNFYLGTDGLGRDVLSRLFMGTRISLLIAFIAAILDITIGVTYGLISGLVGGRVDTVMQRILEVLSGIPNLVVMILMLTVFDPGIVSIVLPWLLQTGYQYQDCASPDHETKRPRVCHGSRNIGRISLENCY